MDILNGNPDYTANYYHHFNIRAQFIVNSITITQRSSNLLVDEVINFITAD